MGRAEHGPRPRPLRNRRTVLKASVCMGVGWMLGNRAARAAPVVPPTDWRPWLLTAPDELRPPPPAPPAPDELTEILTLQEGRTAVTLAVIDRWDDPSIVLPWTTLTLDLIKLHPSSPVRVGRVLALLHVALYDSLVAAWDARVVYPRQGPTAFDPAIVPLGTTPTEPSSFPSSHAAVATAAATVLAYLFPDEPAAGLSALADDAAMSRLAAGRNFRSDVAAGQAIGRAVGERAVAWGKADGSETMWDGSGRLTGPGTWQPTPPGYVQEPLDPLAGSWRTWILGRGDAYRPPPPPPYQSPAWLAELAGVQEAVARRTPEQEEAVRFWAGGPGTVTPAGLWTEIVRELIIREGLDAPHAARVLALVSVAMADSFICCWDAKYTYWMERPITADPTLDVLIPTPPFPSYTSGHSAISAAAATVLGYLFPEAEADLLATAEEAKNSRLWAGIHFPIDNELGAVSGGSIGRLVVARARADGSEGTVNAP